MDIADIERATATDEKEPVVCAADVTGEEWERYEEMARREGEPPTTPVDPKELV